MAIDQDGNRPTFANGVGFVALFFAWVRLCLDSSNKGRERREKKERIRKKKKKRRNRRSGQARIQGRVVGDIEHDILQLLP